MKLVPIADIPHAINTPLDNPLLLLKTCLEMQILCESHKGIGLAAVQVGIPWKLFIVKEEKYSFYVNCQYVGIGEKIIFLEGCLSLPGRYFEVKRYPKIKLLGKKLVNDLLVDIDCELESQVGIVVQHEVDHCYDILISDIGREVMLC